jgi:hypothetical protein
MVLDVAVLAFVFGVTVLTIAVWITHRDMEKLRRDFGKLVNEMHADRALMKQAVASMDNAVNACQRLAEAAIVLARNQPPRQKSAKWPVLFNPDMLRMQRWQVTNTDLKKSDSLAARATPGDAKREAETALRELPSWVNGAVIPVAGSLVSTFADASAAGSRVRRAMLSGLRRLIRPASWAVGHEIRPGCLKVVAYAESKFLADALAKAVGRRLYRHFLNARLSPRNFGWPDLSLAVNQLFKKSLVTARV